jgi:hypothetical protein
MRTLSRPRQSQQKPQTPRANKPGSTWSESLYPSNTTIAATGGPVGAWSSAGSSASLVAQRISGSLSASRATVVPQSAPKAADINRNQPEGIWLNYAVSAFQCGSAAFSPPWSWWAERRWTNDIDGFGLGAQPGGSQGRPLKSRARSPSRKTACPSCVSPESPCSSGPTVGRGSDRASGSQFHAANAEIANSTSWRSPN